MTMRPASRFIALALVAMLALASTPQSAHAGGLRCSIGEVVIENLKIGHTYSLKSLANLPLTLVNTTDGGVELKIDVLVPDASELRQGAEAVPSVTWATAMPDSLHMDAGQTLQSELSLVIPDDERLFGRKFQVTFWSHTLPRPGDLLSYGLKSRVIFSIDAARDTAAVMPEGDLSLEWVPGELWMSRVSRGRQYALVSNEGQNLSLRNTSDRPLTVALRVVHPNETSKAVVSGFGDLLNDADVVLSPATVTLAPGETRSIEGSVRMRRPRQRWTSNLACVISAEVVDQPVRTQLYARVYARTQ